MRSGAFAPDYPVVILVRLRLPTDSLGRIYTPRPPAPPPPRAHDETQPRTSGRSVCLAFWWLSGGGEEGLAGPAANRPRGRPFAAYMESCVEAMTLSRVDATHDRSRQNCVETSQPSTNETPSAPPTVCGRRKQPSRASPCPPRRPPPPPPPRPADSPENRFPPARSAPATPSTEPTPTAAARAATVGNPAGSMPCTQIQQRDKPRRT